MHKDVFAVGSSSRLFTMSLTKFTCPNCQQVLRSSRPIEAGRQVNCPKCGKLFTMPAEVPVETFAIKQSDPALPLAPKNNKAAPAPAAEEIAELDDTEQNGKPEQPRRKVRRRPAKAAVTDTAEEDESDSDDTDGGPRRKLRRPVPKADIDDADDDEDEVEDVDSFADEEEAPRRKIRLKTKPKKSMSSLTLSLIVSGGLVLLLAGAGGGAYWYINRDRNQSKNEDPLVYVPADSAMMIGMDVGTLMNQPLLARAAESANKQMKTNFFESVKKSTGVEFKDLFNTCVFAVGSPGSRGTAALPSKTTLIAKSRVPFDQRKIRDSSKEPKAVRFQGRTYFNVNDGDTKLLYMPSNWFLIASNINEPELQAVIAAELKPAASSSKSLEMARDLQGNHFWLTTSLDGPAGAILGAVLMNPAAPDKKSMAPGAELIKQARAAGLWANISGDTIALSAGLKFDDDQAAQNAVAPLQKMWKNQSKSAATQMMLGAMLPPSIQKLQKEVSSSIAFSAQGTIAQASCTLSIQTLSELMNEAQSAPSLQQPPSLNPRGAPQTVPGPRRGASRTSPDPDRELSRALTRRARER
jgi:predicted RNA-binding Zn-ribbon protein involved in translation (DUF1610 family)